MTRSYYVWTQYGVDGLYNVSLWHLTESEPQIPQKDKVMVLTE